MIILLIVIGVLAAVVLSLTFLLGFRLGGQTWLSELQEVRAEAVVAERQLHDLTRSAFVAMAQEAERRRSV